VGGCHLVWFLLLKLNQRLKTFAFAMDCVRVCVSRFTFVPDECYDTVDAAFAGKPLAEWTIVSPRHSPAFTLTIDKSPQTVIMKCLDGREVVVLSPPPSPTNAFGIRDLMRDVW
jgi:hypothetical protein